MLPIGHIASINQAYGERNCGAGAQLTPLSH
jgi:hypothetical protein